MAVRERYDPNRHDDPILLTAPWADPAHLEPDVLRSERYSWRDGRLCLLDVSFDECGNPVNPHTPHNGRPGRGLLGRWGPNHAVDPVITRGATRGTVHVLVVFRADQQGMVPALPGGMVDVDPRTGTMETRTAALQRELVEEAVESTEAAEAVLRRLATRGEVVHCGYAVDPRNTANAWLETCAVHVHLDDSIADALSLRGRTDETKGAAWLRADEAGLARLYGGHATYVRAALARLFRDV